MMKLGCVTYAETDTGLKAEWLFRHDGEMDHGTGQAIRLTDRNAHRSFEGEYEIIYFDANGVESPLLKLTVSFESGCYHLEWRHNGKLTDLGIGMQSEDKLIVSYTKAT